jgi:methylenetetrahydrofolate dehydrogenase (NADP+)/methenyltetrahydrofolate cyclohydrolase
MTADIIDGKAIAAEVRGEVAEGVARLKAETGIAPGLAVVLVGEDPASQVYVRNKQKAAAEAGMVAEDHKLPIDTAAEVLRSKIDSLNADPSVHGILVQLPLPDHLDEKEFIQRIAPAKDVDGLHPMNMGLLLAGTPRFVSATPAGVQQILLRTGNAPAGKHVVVCGRSDIVGKPVAALLMQRSDDANATVTVCHTRTADIGAITRQADILIAAVGRANFITADMVSEGTVVIDVGINRVEAPERKRGYRLVGDVDFEPVAAKASAITPVPGGVGPMTIAMLLVNTLKAARLAS